MRGGKASDLDCFYDGGRTPYAMEREDGATASLSYDQVGSLRVVADAGGNVIKEVLYDPFGGIIVDSNPGFHVPIGFAGGLHNRDLGFVRFGWRDYDTFTSRWAAPDSLGFAGCDPPGIHAMKKPLCRSAQGLLVAGCSGIIPGRSSFPSPPLPRPRGLPPSPRTWPPRGP